MTAVFLPLAAIALIGAVLRHSVPGMEEARKNLNLLVLYVFLPALVFHTVMNSQLDRLFYVIPLAAATGVLSCLTLGFLAFHFLPIPGETKGAMMLACAFGNVTYFGLPVLLGTFPGHAVEMAQVAVLFEVTKSSLNLSLGAMIAIAYGTQEPITVKKTLGEVIKLPPLWALALALIWKATHVPGPTFLMDATGMLSAGVSGMMILSLGMALKFRLTHLMALLIPVAAIKLLASPYIVAHVVGPLGIAGMFGSGSILEAAMPSQLLSFVIAGRFKLDEETMAFVIMADTLLAFATLPLIHWWLGAG